MNVANNMTPYMASGELTKATSMAPSEHGDEPPPVGGSAFKGGPNPDAVLLSKNIVESVEKDGRVAAERDSAPGECS